MKSNQDTRTLTTNHAVQSMLVTTPAAVRDYHACRSTNNTERQNVTSVAPLNSKFCVSDLVIQPQAWKWKSHAKLNHLFHFVKRNAWMRH